MYRKVLLSKRVCILVISNLLVISPLFSQKVVFNILDRTSGKAQIRFFQRPKVNDDISKEIALGEKKELTDSTFQMTFNPNSPNSIMTCSWIGDHRPIILNSGDSLNVIIDHSEKDRNSFNVIFKGRNENNYNLKTQSQVSEIDQNIIRRVEKTNNLQESLLIIDSIYAYNTSILEKTPPSALKEMRMNEEKANYFYYLYYAQNDSNKVLQHSKLLKLKDKIISKTIECEPPFLIDDPYYTRSINLLYKLLCKNIKSDNKLMASSDTINKYFTGELREFLLSKNFYNAYYSNQKKGKKDPDIEIWYKTYKDKMQEPVYNEYTLFTYNEYKRLNIPFPSDILNEKIISLTDSSEISVGDLLNKYKGSPIIIDHWATWCGACIYEIVEGENNTKIMEEKGVQFIYLSLDYMEDFNKSKQKAIDLKISDKAYILPKGYQTKYIKYLNISFIPRYILIDVEGNIKSADLARPRDISNYDEYIK